MTYTVVAGTPSAAASGTAPTCSVASVVSSDNVLLVVQTNGATTVSASGLGATWGTVYGPFAGTAGQVAYLVGSNPTSSGTITVTLGTFRAYQVHPYVVSGFAGRPVAVGLYSTGTATSMVGPSQTVSTGVVFGGAYMSGSATMTWPTSETPAGTWVASAIGTSSTNRFAAAYSIPTASAAFQTTATFSVSTSSLLSQIWLKEPASYTGEVLADSPVLYWHLDEQAGTTAADASGNGRNGALANTPTLNATSLLAADGGSAIFCDSTTSEKVSIANNTAFNIASATAGFTVEVWLKPSNPDAATLQVISDKSNNSTANGQWTIYYDNRNIGGGTVQNLRFTYAGGGTDYIDWSGTATRDALAAGGHLVCTVDSTTVYIYFNGSLVSSGARSATAPVASTQALTLGCTSANVNFMSATFDEYAIYQSSLSAARVLAHYNAGVGSSGTTTNKTVADPIGITDSVTAQMSASRTISDPVGVTDSVAAALSASRTITDPVGVTDSVTATTSASRTISDPVGITDNVIVEMVYVRDITDSVSITDAVSVSQQMERLLDDPVSVTDDIVSSSEIVINIDDPVGITDNVQALLPFKGGPECWYIEFVTVETHFVVFSETAKHVVVASAAARYVDIDAGPSRYIVITEC